MNVEFDELSYRVIGCALEVHHSLGPGLLESTYHSAMRVALEHRAIEYQSEVRVPVVFEGISVGVARVTWSSSRVSSSSSRRSTRSTRFTLPKCAHTSLCQDSR